MTDKKINIAIDGPAAGGKKTVDRIAAGRLGIVYLDTGMMYRAVCWQALQKNCNLEDKAALGRLAEELDSDPSSEPDSAPAPRLAITRSCRCGRHAP